MSSLIYLGTFISHPRRYKEYTYYTVKKGLNRYKEVNPTLLI